jgi:hypothetical protein
MNHKVHVSNYPFFFTNCRKRLHEREKREMGGVVLGGNINANNVF